MVFILSLLLVLLSLCFSGLATTVIVDDTYGDPLTGALIAYTPVNTWNLGSQCPGCSVKLDASRTHNSTWRDCTAKTGDNRVVQASVQFTGVAVSVHGILTNNHPIPTRLTFFIDEVQMGSYSAQPGAEVVYDVTFWSSPTLAPGRHSLIIQNGNPGGNQSYVLFDYIQYTTADSAKPTSSAADVFAASSSSAALTTSSRSPKSGSTITDITNVTATITLKLSNLTSPTLTSQDSRKPAATVIINSSSSTGSRQWQIGLIVGGICLFVLLMGIGALYLRRRRKLRLKHLKASPFYTSTPKTRPGKETRWIQLSDTVSSPSVGLEEENRMLRQALSQQYIPQREGAKTPPPYHESPTGVFVA
ncbi:hypothetical protein C8J56DRAFT_1039955 [Mycena floridula]|nr:hypothetical protein C8J56DRAFT_1039955 [Mycena floridula]